MKAIMKIVAGGLCMMLASIISTAQKIDEERMQRDIEVAENVLSTLLRQQFDRQHMFFPLEVEGNYQPGYGVTFRLPADFTSPMAYFFSTPDNNVVIWDDQSVAIEPVEPVEPGPHPQYNKTITIRDDDEALREDEERLERDMERADRDKTRYEERKHAKNAKITLKQKVAVDKIRTKGKKKADLDSIQNLYNAKVIEASKNFLADYGDLISQLAPEERIIVTNQGEQPRMWVGKFGDAPNRTHLSIEVLKGDVALYKQGKLNHDQLLSKIKVVDTETMETIEPDIELLSSIFNRLYQPDLSHTYFTEGRIYYERLKDYGVVYYMQAFSSNQLSDYATFSMPTLNLDDLDQEERDQKVKEIYPVFEKELKQNMLEYGRTVKSLKDNEVLVFNVKITKCKGCGIPSSIEISIKSSILKEFGAGKISEASALDKVVVKRGVEQ